ncbi:MAG: hypothetical protein HYU67_07920 [Flavobacteriia bacterium]|nr:hypothetical protein [Flavobacteriia bacterium]
MKKQLLKYSFILFSFGAFSQVPSYVPTDGLVGWWPFNGNADDESGNGNDGTVNSATLSTDRNGVANSAYYFSSTNCESRIDVDINSSSITNGITISVWIKRNDDGCQAPRFLEAWPGSNTTGHIEWAWGNTFNSPHQLLHRLNGSSGVGNTNFTTAVNNSEWLIFYTQMME